MTECALCHAPASYLEHLSSGEVFCNACARCYRVDADGKVVAFWSTVHPAKRVEKDVSGTIVSET
jgi:hypothetical protein